jgi:hypothetical protein
VPLGGGEIDSAGLIGCMIGGCPRRELVGGGFVAENNGALRSGLLLPVLFMLEVP